MSRIRLHYRPGHPAANERGFVDSRDLYEVETARALDAPIMMDRFYENTGIPEYDNGVVKMTDVGSRRKHREFLHRKGVTVSSDFDKPGGEWDRAAEQRKRMQAGDFDHKERREAIARTWHELEKKNARRG